MKKILSILVFMFSLLSLAVLTACSTKIDEDYLKNLSFPDTVVEYDGQPHSIYVEDLPEGATVTYSNNNKTNPGEYTVVANIKYEDLKVNLKAKLTINYLTSLLEANTEQTVYLYGGDVLPKYTLNNTEQTVTMVITKDGQKLTTNDLYRAGQYSVELYAPSKGVYAESNHVTVTLNVVDSIFDVDFEDAEYVYDGTEKTLALAGDLPAGYTVEYVDNKGTEVGSYYSLAKIKDSTGAVIETLAATLTIDYALDEEFQEYLDEFFVAYLEGDQLSVNIFCQNPADFGLEHYDAKWYTYSSFDESDAQETIESFQELLTELEGFKDNQLNDLQRVAYKNIESFLQYYIDFYSINNCNYKKLLYVDSFGGYVADFGTYMEAYTLRGEQEVQDIVSFITSTQEAFPSYLEFVKDKTEAGYPLSDYTINEMRGYLEELLAKDENDEQVYYLEAILFAKIDGLDFLTEEKKSDYKNQIATAIDTCFFPGVEELYNGLESYLGKLAEEDEGYWATYEDGKDLYMLELQDLFGFENFDILAYIKELDEAFADAAATVSRIQNQIIKLNNISSYDQLNAYLARYAIHNGTPEEMMVYLNEFAKTIVPSLQNEPNITIKNMDEASAKVSNAVAYYMKSALDNKESEYITLNPLKLGDKNDVLSTLAHEGYPGHLYAYVYSKELGLSNLSTIMTSTAHAEGWATYVVLKLYEQAKANSTDKNFRTVMDYLYANQMAGYLLETRIDVGIHYQGWDVDKVSKFLDDNGYNGGAAQGIYDLIIEMPSGYAAYGYGKLFFVKLHEKAQEILGGFYDEIEFNAMLLSKGWTTLGELQNTYNDYMTAKCHKYGLAFE